jgi:hypothetical protein
MKIPSLQNYPRRPRGSHFYDLPPEQRELARGWLKKFCNRRRAQGKSIPPWLKGIYVGQARRLAKNPPDSAWGRKMLARRGGLAAQAKYRAEGRDPLALANIVKDRKRRSKARMLEEDRDGLMQMPEPSMDPICLKGSVDPGVTSQRTAEEIQKEIMQALAQAFSRDTRFGEHIAGPAEGYVWEVMLVPVRHS